MSANPAFEDPPIVSLAPAVPVGVGAIEAPDPQISRLQGQLATERSAGTALIGAIMELERRLVAERARAERLVPELAAAGAALDAARTEIEQRRHESGALWGQISLLNGAVSDAYNRPLLKRLFGRRA